MCSAYMDIESIQFNSSTHPASSVLNQVLDLIDTLSCDQLNVFFTLLWAVWKARNDVLWNGDSFDVWWILQWALRWLGDYKEANRKVGGRKLRPKVKWKCPPSGRLKINGDGAFYNDSGKGGIRVVVLDNQGDCVAALAKHFPHAASALHMETEAFKAGLLLGVHEGWSNVEIQCDCAVLVSVITRTDDDFSEVGRSVED